MSVREVGWMLFLAGLPFAHFFSHKVDIWHAQTAWAQAGLALVFCLGLQKTVRPIIRNLPLACFTLWVCWQSLYIWQVALPGSKEYPSSLLMPWLHAMSLTLFYLATTTQWTSSFLIELFRWLARGAALITVYGFLQLLNLDQFYRHVEWNKLDPLMGTIGNQSHFGIHLALLLPIVLMRPRWYWRLLAVAMGVLIGLTNSAVGLVCAVLALGWWCLWLRRKLLWLPLMLLLLGSVWVWKHPDYLNPEGRLQVLALNWQDYAATEGVQRQHAKPTITGFGLGYTMARSQIASPASPFKSWKHVHNAPLQLLMELGVIGFAILLWGLCAFWKQAWQVRTHPLAVVCTGMFLIFSLASCFHFVDHLWLTASLGLVGYCGVYVLHAEQSEV